MALPVPSPKSRADKYRSVLRLWALALALSAALTAAGQRWPQPLEPDLRWVVTLVLGVPLLVGLVLVLQWQAAGENRTTERKETR